MRYDLNENINDKLVSVYSALSNFGRNVFRKGGDKQDRTKNFGAIYHMGEVFDNNRVELNLETLTSHCFITGSTGSGKFNTTSKLIDELTKPSNDVKFLVSEPAKGEYKIDFGGMPEYLNRPLNVHILCMDGI